MIKIKLFEGVSRPMMALWTVVFALSLVLSSANTGLFASPDETAVASALVQIAKTGKASQPEPFAEELPWLHPRSYVAVGAEIIPVGFLGWPWWLAQLSRFLPLVTLPWIASLLAASGIIPWSLLLRRRYGSTAAWWGTALAWLFPSVLLYVNRSYFSHLPQISLLLWSWWLSLSVGSRVTGRLRLPVLGLAGILLGTAVSFRSVEAIWILPFFAAILYTENRAMKQDWSWREWGALTMGAGIGFIPTMIVQSATYGAFWRIGYWLRGNPERMVFAPVVVRIDSPPSMFTAWMPYGFHPRNILWNIQSFLLVFLWPWTLLFGTLALFLCIKNKAKLFKEWFVKFWPLIGSLCFMGGWLLVVYGSGLYTDHVRVGAVTMGNSFLRYTVVFAFIGAWLVASVHATRTETWVRRTLAVVSTLLIGVGLFYAFAHDDEGLLATRAELKRYEQIRAVAHTTFSAGDIILSDRSDKIFFPGLRAVSPMPSLDQRKNLAIAASSSAIGLFSAPLSFTQRDDWRKIGYDVREIQSFNRERLYRLTPFLR